MISSALYIFNSTKFKAHSNLKTVKMVVIAAVVLKGNFNMLFQQGHSHDLIRSTVNILDFIISCSLQPNCYNKNNNTLEY